MSLLQILIGKYENMPREEKYELENNLHGARNEIELLDQDWG